MNFDTIHLGIACPMASEEETCVPFVRALLAECDRFPFRELTFFVVLDRASKDRTRELLEAVAATEPRLRVVWAPENRCVVDAYVRGYREAIAAQCDWILEVDGGFSHDPADAPRFFETMAQGYDCVFGTRLGLGGSFHDASLKRRTISRSGTLLTNLLLGTRLSDMTSGYELFTRQALQMVLDHGIQSRAHFFQTEIKVFCRRLNCAEVPISYSHPSPHLSNAAVFEAFARLGDLVRRRWAGNL
jgi:dolichol-phosphate mannosyltransferase